MIFHPLVKLKEWLVSTSLKFKRVFKYITFISYIVTIEDNIFLSQMVTPSETKYAWYDTVVCKVYPVCFAIRVVSIKYGLLD